ncbi:hypothetical protein BVG16_10080 [Paenibacillus selenitireducens]|uniref:HAMP domain-containing protein n=1 Tax=Paenibacillus selenitireducens TaxID=1324314 RepID=A0A1T2XHX9_9BACL|nr:histidine kinase [Paenibacillus selenitireducens]OPA79415.1 hypothetical protein BVG16_10080 [Paenibacillus selenitireducens]
MIEWYKQHFRRKMFNKLLIVYSSITILSLLALSIVAYQYYADHWVQKELNMNKQVLEGIRSYVDGKYLYSMQTIQQLYTDQAMLEDVLYFLKHDISDYSHYRLDQYAKSSGFTARNMNVFFHFRLEGDSDVDSMMLYSKDQQFIYTFKPYDIQKYMQLADPPSELLSASSGSGAPKFIRITPSAPYADIIPEKSLFSTQSAINDPATLQSMGSIIMNYNANGIGRILHQQQDPIKGYIVVLSKEGKVIYDSSDRYYGATYPYMQQMSRGSGTGMLAEESYVDVLTSSKTDFLIASVLPKAELYAANRGLRNTIIFVTAGCIVAAILFTYAAIRNVSRRTQTIVKAMRRLQNGDLSVRIPLVEEDELSLISSRFNHMCEELNDYINRVYLSEVKKKHAELIALQAQIKPHFLYNTLEAIRMRALSKSAHDVADMICILSNLLKYSIKYDTIVTMVDELEYCRQYLELFQIRYKNKFAYTITMDQEISHISVIKCSLQPIIENYIMHGIWLNRHDNEIHIRVTAEDGYACVSIQDNGKGMSAEKLEQLRERLNQLDEHSHASIGLRNVNERLKIIYGEECHLHLDSRMNAGTNIRMMLPYAKGGELAHV